jgi:hypothetical protein
MPAIAEKRTVLNGRGIVGVWANGTSAGKFFYREKVEGRKAYRFKELLEASNLDEAERLATEAAIELRETKPPAPPKNYDPLDLIAREEKLVKQKERLIREEKKKESPKEKLEKVLDDWLSTIKKKADAGTIEQSTYEFKWSCMRHVRFYIKHKKITLTSQINESTFDDYVVFRMGQTERRLTIQKELQTLGEFVKSYLVKHRYIPARLWLDGQFLPKIEVRQTDRDANPAINEEDWKTIVEYVRNVWRKEAYTPWKLPSSNQFRKEVKIVERKTTDKSIWFRTMFWHWILVAKNSGMSPEEICKLKWKNVEIVDVGRVSNTKAQEEWEQVMGEAQAEGRELELEAPDLKDPSEWAPEGTEWGREERLIAYITTMRAKTQEYREIPCNLGHVFKRWSQFLRTQLNVKINGDDYVFAQVFNDMKIPSQRRIGQYWRGICDLLMSQGKLTGHKFSDRPYTLYSMRSTFIENHILRGTDAYLLARICGNSVATIMMTYERIDIRRRTKELTDIEFGSKKQNLETIQLFDE